MISNLAIIDNPKVRELGFKLMELPHVVDIRFFPTLRDDLKQLAGENVVTYTAVILKNDKFQRVFVITPEEMYTNDDMHQMVIDQMISKISDAMKNTTGNLIDAIVIPESTPKYFGFSPQPHLHVGSTPFKT
jgi:hypothetical protein